MQIGDVKCDESSVTVVCSVNKIYNEDTLKAQGKLDDMTFDEFAAQNSGRQQVQMSDAALYDPMVANATGIPTGEYFDCRHMKYRSLNIRMIPAEPLATTYNRVLQS